MGKNLYEKVWDVHAVDELESGMYQVFIGLHLIHEVTSPQAFQSLRENKIGMAHPERTFGTIDHIIPTDVSARPFKDPLAEKMTVELYKNVKDFGVKFFDNSSANYGIVHVIGPELGLTQPGMTIVCGDSHTSTHGAFGSIAFGIGTSQVKDVLATQTLAVKKLKVRKVCVDGKLGPGVYAKDVILKIINELGVNGGLGYAYEFCGETIENMSMEERMTICNMSIEGGARVGYINPDETTFEYLKGRKYAPKDFDKAVEYWKSIASDEDADYDAEVYFNAEEIEPYVTWGINPGQSVGVSGNLPITEKSNGEKVDVKESSSDDVTAFSEAFEYMDFSSGQPIKDTAIDVVFIGSCTNSRISDLRIASEIVNGKKVADSVRALVVPGSKDVYDQALEEGLDVIFKNAGFDWRQPGCSMCLAMNPDKLSGNEVCASTSNRNFKGRQGSPTGRTLLMSPAMAAAAAIKGEVVDVREF